MALRITTSNRCLKILWLKIRYAQSTTPNLNNTNSFSQVVEQRTMLAFLYNLKPCLPSKTRKTTGLRNQIHRSSKEDHSLMEEDKYREEQMEFKLRINSSSKIFQWAMGCSSKLSPENRLLRGSTRRSLLLRRLRK